MKTFLAPVALAVATVSWPPLPSHGGVIDDWVAEALSKNPSIAAARAAAEMSRSRVGMDGALMDPMAGVKWMRSENTDLLDPDMTEWSLEQTVPWPGKRGARARAAGAAADAADLAADEVAASVRARVTSAYWDLWNARRRTVLMNEALGAMVQMEEAARARYATADGAAQADVLRAGIEVAKMRNELETMRRMEVPAQAMVNALLAAPAATARETERDPPVLPGSAPDPSALLERALARGPSVLSAAARRTAAAARLETARRESAPDLRFMVEARQQEGSASIREYDTTIGITLPWLWRGKYSSLRREADADLRMAEADADAMRHETSSMLADLCVEADAAHRGVRLLEDEIAPRSRQLIDASLAAYRTGQGDFMAVIDAVKQDIQVRRDAADARASFGRAAARIEWLVGGPISGPSSGKESQP